MILRTMGALVLVIALIYGLSWAARKYLRADRWASQIPSLIKVVHSQSLEPKKRLIVIEVEGRRLLLGVTEQQIQVLSHLDSQNSEGLEGSHGNS